MPPTPDEMTLTPTASVDSVRSAFGDRLDRALHVGLEDDLHLLDLARLDLVEDVLQRHARRARQLLLAALRRGGARPAPWPPSRRSTTLNVSPASGTPSRPSTSTGVDGPASVMLLPLVVQHGADLPRELAGDDQVADAQRALLDQDGRDRAAGAIEARLDDVALGRACSGWPSARAPRPAGPASRAACRCPPWSWPRRRRRWCRRPTPRGPGRAPISLLRMPVRVGARLVDLVDRDDDRDLAPPWRG